MRTLGASEFKLRFADSVLGYVWTLSKPLMLFGVMYLVFSKMLRFGEAIPYYPILLLMGIMSWQFFAEATSGAVTILVSRADLIRKASFPRSALAVSVVATAYGIFLCNVVALAAFVAIAGPPAHAGWLWLLPLSLELLVVTTAASLLLSGLFVFLRDIGQLWAVLLQLLFYATPIIYPIELLSEQGVPLAWQRALLASPLAQITQDSRAALVGSSTPSSADILGPLAWVPYAVVLVLLFAGLHVYRTYSDRIAERV